MRDLAARELHPAPEPSPRLPVLDDFVIPAGELHPTPQLPAASSFAPAAFHVSPLALPSAAFGNEDENPFVMPSSPITFLERYNPMPTFQAIPTPTIVRYHRQPDGTGSQTRLVS